MLIIVNKIRMFLDIMGPLHATLSFALFHLNNELIWEKL